MFKAQMQNYTDMSHLRSALDSILTLLRDKAFSLAVGESGEGGWLEKHQRRADIHVLLQKSQTGGGWVWGMTSSTKNHGEYW